MNGIEQYGDSIVKSETIGMTRDEYVAYIYEEYHKYFDEKPDSKRAQYVLKEFYEIFNKIMSKELSVKEIKNCFLVLERMYSIRSNIDSPVERYLKNGLFQSELSFIPKHEADETTTGKLENELEALRNEADSLKSLMDEKVYHCSLDRCSTFSFQIYFKQWDLEIGMLEIFWDRAEKLGIDMDEEEDWDKKVATEEELQFKKQDPIQECVSLLESIIGWQPEFDEILQMG